MRIIGRFYVFVGLPKLLDYGLRIGAQFSLLVPSQIGKLWHLSAGVHIVEKSSDQSCRVSTD